MISSLVLPVVSYCEADKLLEMLLITNSIFIRASFGACMDVIMAATDEKKLFCIIF